MTEVAFQVKACGGVHLLVQDLLEGPIAQVIVGDNAAPTNKILVR